MLRDHLAQDRYPSTPSRAVWPKRPPAETPPRVVEALAVKMGWPVGVVAGRRRPARGGVRQATAAASGVTGAAYTNNDLAVETATTLYDIDTTLDQVVLQSPANSGQLSPVGKLGVDASGDAGFDIYASVRGGRATDAVGYAVLNVGSRAGVYQISLVTGHAHRISAVPKKWQLTDLAVGLDRS